MRTNNTTMNPPWDTMKQELQSIVRAELNTIMASNVNGERQQQQRSKSPSAFKRPQSLPMTSTVRKDYPFAQRTNVNKAVMPVTFDDQFNETTFARRCTINLSCLPEEESILERTSAAAGGGNQTVIVRDDREFVAIPRGSKRFSRVIEKENEPPPVAFERRRSCRISMNFNRNDAKKNAVPEVVAKPAKKSARGAPQKNKVIAEYFHSNESMARGNNKISKKDHKNAVLKLINCGSIKELQILPTIGLKTAFQLITNRTLKGKFKTFEEIAKLPMWRGKGWVRFQQENNLI
jgi:hypothetical protein